MRFLGDPCFWSPRKEMVWLLRWFIQKITFEGKGSQIVVRASRDGVMEMLDIVWIILRWNGVAGNLLILAMVTLLDIRKVKIVIHPSEPCQQEHST